MANEGRGFALPITFTSSDLELFGDSLKPGLTRNFEYITWFMNTYVPQLVDGTWTFDFPIEGDIVSANWDGADPPVLTSRDVTASAGYAIDSSEGSMQLEGSLFVEGDIDLSGTSTLSANYVAGTSGFILQGDGTAEFNDVTIRGDIESANWDGASPANLTTEDATATAGFYLDSSVGAAQFEGDLFVEGDLHLGGQLLMQTSGDIESNNWNGASPADLSSVQDATATAGFYLDGSAGAGQFMGDLFVGGDIELISSGLITTDITNNATARLLDVAGAGVVSVAWAGTTVGAIRANGTTEFQISDGSGDNTIRFNSIQPSWFIETNTNDILEIRQTQILANDGSTGQVEMWPQAFIASGNSNNGTDQLNITSNAWVTLTHNVDVTCDYANQPVMVQASIMVRWKDLTASGDDVRLRLAFNGTAVSGTLAINSIPDLQTTADDPGDTNAGGDNVDVDGTSSSGNGTHNHPAKTSSITSGHTHTVDPDSISSGSHTHASGSYTVNGTHTHTMGTHSHTLTTFTWISQTAVTMGYLTTADGSANLEIGAEVWGTGTADIDESYYTYTVWRR